LVGGLAALWTVAVSSMVALCDHVASSPFDAAAMELL